MMARLGAEEDRTRYVVGFAFNIDRTRVALIEKTHGPVGADMEGTLNGLGGECRSRESYDRAMVREFLEEGGALFDGWRRFAIIDGPGYRVICYTVTLSDAEWRLIRTGKRSKTDEIVRKVSHRRAVTDKGPHGMAALVAIARDPGLWRTRCVHIDRRSL